MKINSLFLCYLCEPIYQIGVWVEKKQNRQSSLGVSYFAEEDIFMKSIE